MSIRRRFDAALHLLDRQIEDPDGRLVAKVDDLEVVEGDDGRLRITAVLVGPGALGERVRGSMGRIAVATWCRLRQDSDPQPGRIEWEYVESIDSAVHVRRTRDQLGVEGLEDWARREIVSRIPGARHEPE